MNSQFFNYQTIRVGDHWQRRAFLRIWWKFYGRDPQWVPPYYPALRKALQPDIYLQPQLLYLEAVRGTPEHTPQQGAPVMAAGWEHPVAAAVALNRGRGTASPALLRCANDTQTLRYMLEAVAEATGARRLVGPTHLSPYLGAGVLDGHWHLLPPLHTPYNPPYLSELLSIVMKPILGSQLYHLPVRSHLVGPAARGPATLIALDPARLAGDLLLLLQEAVSSWQPVFMPPGAAEAAFLLRWLGMWPLQGWLALMEGQPAGFVLVQPDLAPLLRRAKGGRRLFWRLWLQRRVQQQAAKQGRLLFGTVLPAWRGQGIGQQLLAAAREEGVEQGWESLVIGPVPEGAGAERFLKKAGSEPRQQYQVYQWEAPSLGWW